MDGKQVIKNIGFDYTEDHRLKTGGTYAVGKGTKNVCPDPELPNYYERYDIRYPLMEQKITREMCRDIIVDAGLPVPCKSACYFCPASKEEEVRRLAVVDPSYYCLAIAIEVIFRLGHHFKGEYSWEWKAKRKDTGEKFEDLVVAKTAAEARQQARAVLDDEARPYKCELKVSRSKRGLNFGEPWLKIPAELPEPWLGKLVRFLEVRGHSFTVEEEPIGVLTSKAGKLYLPTVQV